MGETIKFDESFIAIRSRSNLEIFDLTLQVIRRYPLQLLGYLALGAVGIAVADHLILLNYASMQVYDFYPTEYGWALMLLVISQAQIGTSFVTSFLGHAMFVGQPRFGEVVRDVFRVSPGLFWLHGILRTTAFVFLFTCLADRDKQFDSSVTWMVLATIAAVLGMFVRSLRPYVTEILVLERAPFRQRNNTPITFGVRSRMIHQRVVSDSLSLFILILLFAGPLILSVFSVLVLGSDLLGITTEFPWLRVFVVWPIALWIVAGFFSIVRFLSYVDARIRQEGWEVELKIRAAALKLLPEGQK